MRSNLDQSETGGSQTPTTPRPIRAEPIVKGETTELTTPSTPTRDNFGGVSGQRPLPEEPFTPQREQNRSHDSEGSIKRPVSQRATASPAVQDVEMGDPDEDDGAGEDDGSDNDSVTSDSQRPSKKKKGQRFFCTEYPPCQLNFTRSEHLARHIRKHTGERPFQCHCSRRFSRLDNLRQHAQTVHVNEDIPGDSLAATSTRFQRQIRTERVRPPTARSRASTIGSQGAHSRGHSRTLSASSVGSTTSSIGGPEDLRRRPQPIAMANDPSARARLSLNTFDASGTGGSPQQYGQYSQSPSGYSTPTSTSFSTGPGSPSGMASPSSTISRSSYYNGSRHARRLSVPSGPRPFQFPMAPSYSASHFEPIPSGTSVTFSPGSGSLVSSPTSSIFHGRRDSETELEYRRRTWHPGTNNNYSQRPATSGLMYHQTVDDQRPATSNQPAASQMNSSHVKLPGIESFDHVPPTPARGSPMLVDAQPPNPGRPSDGGLHQNLTRLDITAANAPIENQWQALRPSGPAQHSLYSQQQPSLPASYTSHPPPEQPVTPRKNKRQGFYGGIPQPSAQSYLLPRTSPEDSGSSDGVPTPSTFQSTEYNPVIVNHNGGQDPLPPSTALPDDQKVYYVSSYNKPEPARADSGFQPYAQPPQHTYALQSGHDPRYPTNGDPPQNTDMSKLEALVAVATREDRAQPQ